MLRTDGVRTSARAPVAAAHLAAMASTRPAVLTPRRRRAEPCLRSAASIAEDRAITTPLPMPEVDLSVVVVNYNTAHLLHEVFGKLAAATAGLRTQVIVVDNASRDDSVAVLRRDFPQHELIANPDNVGFARANNLAVPRLRGEYVLLLNTDAFVAADTVHATVAHLRSQPDIGVLGVRLVGADGSLQACCRTFPTPMNLWLGRCGWLRIAPWLRPVDDLEQDHTAVRDCDWVPGCYFLMPRALVDRIGLFDPRYFLYYEEVDLCRAVKNAGWRVVFFGRTTVVHVGGESAKSDAKLSAGSRQISNLQAESEVLYVRKHHGLFGLCAHVALTWLGVPMLALRNLLKRRGAHELPVAFGTAAQLQKAFFATRLGARPTR
jgi:N-acetylglucosaminyl-diphospho-decaprenol L-rhamnosyltransferase